MICRKLGAQGLSLVEVLLVVSILGFISLVVATSFSDIFRMQTQVMSRDEVNDFGASVGRFIFTETTCTAALKGQIFPVGGGPNPLILKGYNAYGSDTAKKDIQAGEEIIANRLKVRDLTIADKLMPPQAVKAGGMTLQRYLARIDLTIETKAGKANNPVDWVGAPVRTYEIPVVVDPVDSNRIYACNLEMKVSDACQVLGSELDPNTGRCTPMTQCIFEGHYSTNECSNSSYGCPSGVINELTGGYNCPSGVATARQTGINDWSYSVSCGKKCTATINVRTQYYVCLKCTSP